MLENLIRDARLATMQAMDGIKDVVHEATTKLPDQVQKDFTKLDKQAIDVPNDSEMTYLGTGWNVTANVATANQIDMIADKMNFIANMIQNGLLSFDAIETELRAMATQPTPPQPAQLIGLAARIDSCQKQTFDGLQELRKLTVHIDQATDKLQGGTQQGWSATQISNPWNK